MAIYAGNAGSVDIGSSAVGQVTGWTYATTAVVPKAHAMGDTSITSIAGGAIDGSGSVTCLWDWDDAGQVAAIEATTVVLHLFSEGESVGDLEITGNAIISGVNYSGETDGVWELSFTFDGVLTVGTVPA